MSDEKPMEIWVNQYPDSGLGAIHLTPDAAEKSAEPSRIACIHFIQAPKEAV